MCVCARACVCVCVCVCVPGQGWTDLNNRFDRASAISIPVVDVGLMKTVRLPALGYLELNSVFLTDSMA